MRLKSGIWVAAYLRRCQVEGAAAVLRRRGAEEAGAIFIKVSRLDGIGRPLRPGAAVGVRRGAPERARIQPRAEGLPLPEADVEAYLGTPAALRSGSVDRRGRGPRRAVTSSITSCADACPGSLRAGACGSAAVPRRRVVAPRRERRLVVVVHRAMRAGRRGRTGSWPRTLAISLCAASALTLLVEARRDRRSGRPIGRSPDR